MQRCSKCGGNTDGYKCKQCSQEMFEPDPYHPCGRERVQQKCAACGQAEDNCLC